MRLGTLVLALLPALALAKPPAPGVFCTKYPTAPVCTGGQPACTYCHSSPPTRNAYGAKVETALVPTAPRPLSDGDFSMALPAALGAAESADSDGDGYSNLLEIQRGTFPGDPRSFPAPLGPCDGPKNPGYAVCTVDNRYLFRKVQLDFCGFSPTYDALEAFAKSSDQTARLDALLDTCLKSDFWRGKNGQVWELAHKKIRPVGTLKSGSEEKGLVPLADYYDDYALYTWSQIDDHDARDVLTADFFVTRAGTGPTVYSKVANRAGQGVDQAHRAGNLSSAWSLAYFVMFTALPRNAAAQGYRAYLGLDIAKQEGLYPIPNEPKDYDAKGVQGALCSQCHATLDPLSYPFRNYNGLTNPNPEQYVPNRIETQFAGLAPNISQIPEKGYILGQPVNDLKGWARVAADSDAFAANTVMDYWKLLMGGPPTPDQNDEFVKLWKRLKNENTYSVQKMLHELIHTEAYGAP
ncbi:MAG: hypothetical protein K1X89_07780 [Myxococcaceae bacterium]|nr:hypothetical protein [Myxococcaceae bacterium]